MKIQTKFQMEGISKRTISLEDQKKLILQGKDSRRDQLRRLAA
jgi:type I restriction enzyme R subunit